MGFAGFGGSGGMSQADGKFIINGLTHGEYIIRANLPGGIQEQAIQNLTIDGSDISDLQLVVAKQSTLRGRVTFEQGGTPPQASTIRITAMRDDPMVGGFGNVTVKDDLTFEMLLTAGRVFVRSPPSGPNWRLSRVWLSGIDVTDTGIEVPVNGTLSDVVVELTDHLYPISGRVTDANGSVVRDCFVIVFAQNPAAWTPGTRYQGNARPGLDDLFHLKMPAGDYYAVAITEVDQGAWTDPEFLNQVRDRATAKLLLAGQPKINDKNAVRAFTARRPE